MSAICPGCGKEVKKGFCKECFLKLHPFRLKDILIKSCSCGRYFYRVEWRENLEKDLPWIVKRNLLLPEDITLKEVNLLANKKVKGGIKIEVEVKGKYQDEEITKRIPYRIKVEKSQCDRCQKRPEYYEAIMQLRGEPLVKISPNQVSNVVKVRGGFDFYLKDKGYARKVAKEFKKKDFQIKESEKLMGIRANGKRKSRLTISVKQKKE